MALDLISKFHQLPIDDVCMKKYQYNPAEKRKGLLFTDWRFKREKKNEQKRAI
jgi:hypothetical protein